MKLQMSMLWTVLALFGLTVMTSCDDEKVTGEGQVTLYLTDSPVDRTDVEAAVVTIAEVRLDGQTWEGFNGPMTIDLLTYQKGATKLMGSADLESRAYADIELVLDLEQDASGNTPGCYVMTDDQTKHALAANAASETSIDIVNSAFTVEENQENNLLIDFDLRKTITSNSGGSSDFAFVSESELNSGLRLVRQDETGRIEGNCDDAISSSDRIVAYAYVKGTYNNQELQGQGASNIRFANAVTSAAVDADGSYTLAFLKEGDYELIFASYEEQPDGSLSLQGTLLLDTLLNLDLQSISVQSNATVEVDVLVTGLLPL